MFIVNSCCLYIKVKSLLFYIALDCIKAALQELGRIKCKFIQLEMPKVLFIVRS